MTGLWEHGVRTSGLAQGIATQAGLSHEERDNALSAGLLHDVGKLALAAIAPDRVNAVFERMAAGEGSFIDIERRHHKATHADVGSYLLGTWGLPIPVVTAIARHHNPADSETVLGTVTVVHVANAIDHLLQTPDAIDALLAAGGNLTLPGCDMRHLETLGVLDALPAWLQVARDRLQAVQPA